MRNVLTLVALAFCIGLVLVVQLAAIGFAISSPGMNTELAIVFAVIALSLFFRWSMAIPACVIEGLGLSRSLSRGGDLIKGYRLKVLVVVLVAVVSSAMMVMAVAMAPTLVLGVGLTLVFGPINLRFGPVLAMMFLLLWISIWSAFLAVLSAVIYYELRVVKEGTDTDQIAAVFD